MDQIEVVRSGSSGQFSVVLTRGGDTIRCMVSVAVGANDEADDKSAAELHRAALSKAKALARAMDAAIADT